MEGRGNEKGSRKKAVRNVTSQRNLTADWHPLVSKGSIKMIPIRFGQILNVSMSNGVYMETSSYEFIMGTCNVIFFLWLDGFGFDSQSTAKLYWYIRD